VPLSDPPAHITRPKYMRMSRESSANHGPRHAKSTTVPIDHTRWMAVVIEIVAISGAVALAYLHTAA